MKCIKILLFILFCFLQVRLQANVIVEGKLINIKVKEPLYYYEPINGFFNQYYNPRTLNFKKNSLDFKIDVAIKKEGFLCIMLPDKPIRLFVGPYDTIYFEVYYISDTLRGKYIFDSISFRGNNAKGHEYYVTNPAYVLPQDFLLVHSFAKKSDDIGQFFDSTQADLETLLRPFKDALNAKMIDSGYYKMISADIKGNCAWNIINIFGFLNGLKDKKMPKNEKFKSISQALSINGNIFNQNNYDKLRLMIYKQIDPYDPAILFSTMGIGYTTFYAQDIFNSKVISHSSYDSSFLSLKPSLWYFGYMKRNFLELNWAGELYWGVVSEPDKNELKKNYTLFASYFPYSPFIPHLKKRLNGIFNEANSSYQAKGEVTIFSKEEYPTLKALVLEKFNSNYVFVDLWATWCSPCLKELIYKDQLKAFLDEKKIKLLYISIDKPFEKNRWENFVYKRKMYGYHFMASEEFTKHLEKLIYLSGEISIPRYLLIDKNGEIKSADLPRPSDMVSLKKELNKLIR